MEIKGTLRKMRSELNNPVSYYLPVGEQEIQMNPLVGRVIQMTFTGEIHCIRCGKKTRKSFSQGYCYPCFITAPETEECVLRPELCRAHEGIARDMNYAERNCLIDHVVYLSQTSGLKVGVTRSTQVPFRWIDQGAVCAIELARTPNRHIAGLIEVTLKKFMKDKTDWRNMLKNKSDFEGNLIEQKTETAKLLLNDQLQFVTSNDDITYIHYPVVQYPIKVSSLNFEKNPVVEGRLVGIKGQYLMFGDETVINIRNFGGYQIRMVF